MPKVNAPDSLSAQERADRRTERLTDRLLVAASRFFMEKGFEGTSMGEIARYAHASKETFYRHYPTKEELFRAVLIRQVADMAKNVGAVLVSHEPPSKALTTFGEVVLDRLITRESLALHRILTMERARFPDLAIAVHEQGRAKILSSLAQYLEEQVAEGRLRKMDARVGARQLLDLIASEMIMRAAFNIPPAPTKAEHRKRVKEAIECFLQGYGSSSKRSNHS